MTTRQCTGVLSSTFFPDLRNLEVVFFLVIPFLSNNFLFFGCHCIKTTKRDTNAAARSEPLFKRLKVIKISSISLGSKSLKILSILKGLRNNGGGRPGLFSLTLSPIWNYGCNYCQVLVANYSMIIFLC